MVMKVNKEQIQHIDSYLKSKGIKYWDVRMEMVDHLVTDIENYQGNETDFEILFKNSLQKLNWDRNLKDIHLNSWRTTNRMYQKKLWKEIILLVKSPLNLIALILLFFLLNWFATNQINILKYSIIFMAASVLLLLGIYGFKVWKNKLGNSVNLAYGISYFHFGFTIIQLPIQLAKEISFFEKIMPLIILIFVITTIAGFRVFKYSYGKVLEMKGIKN
jgi:hypothetical protein